MNATEVLATLRAAGKAQTRKTYARHGVTGDCFGVSYAELYKLQKKIGVDHELFEALWATGNHDARILGLLVADPASFRARSMDRMVKELDDHVIAAAFGTACGRSPSAVRRIEKWIGSKKELIAVAGWEAVGPLTRDGDGPDDAYFEGLLERIESDLHDSPNRVRHSMNGVLISIGLRNPTLRRLATAAARRIGPVEVDHGATSCKTPDAVAAIRKAVARRR